MSETIPDTSRYDRLAHLLDDPRYIASVATLASEKSNFAEAEYPRATHAGIGDTFISVYDDEPFDTPMFYEVPFEEDCDGVTEKSAALKVAITIDGKLSAGIDMDDNLVQRIDYSPIDDDTIFNNFRQSLSRKAALINAGIEPIFTPTEAYYPGQDIAPRSKQVASLFLSKIIENTQDSFDDLKYYKQLALHYAAMAGPKYRVVVGGKQLELSELLPDMGSGRPAILLYTEEDKLSPTYFYQSKSHATWRALLARGAEGWYAKGMFGSENSADAPLALQKIFSALQDFADKSPSTYYTRSPIDSHQAKLVVPEVRRRHAKELRQPATILAKATLELAGVAEWNNTNTAKRWSNDTTSGRFFLPEFKPDFSSSIDSWESDTEFYGRVRVSVYPSKNKKVNYAIYEAGDSSKPQRWVGTAEVANAKITSLGLPKEWVNLHDEVTKPPTDYVYTYKDGEQKAAYGARRSDRSSFESFVTRSMAAYRAKH